MFHAAAIQGFNRLPAIKMQKSHCRENYSLPVCCLRPFVRAEGLHFQESPEKLSKKQSRNGKEAQKNNAKESQLCQVKYTREAAPLAFDRINIPATLALQGLC